MKFVKGISLFFIYPVVMFGIGFYAGVQLTHYFYPGEQQIQNNVQEFDKDLLVSENESIQSKDYEYTQEPLNISEEMVSEVSSSMETLSVDTEYVLEETDMEKGSVVETVWRLPDKYIGLNREQFLDAMENYELFPPLSEIERGFVSLEVLSFSRERVVVRMNYRYVQPSTSFYLAVINNEVVVYLEDMETIYINTGIELTSLPEEMQLDIMQMLWIEDEESLYNFLENYSS